MATGATQIGLGGQPVHLLTQLDVHPAEQVAAQRRRRGGTGQRERQPRQQHDRSDEPEPQREGGQ
jgi:sRNA-binding protein